MDAEKMPPVRVIRAADATDNTAQTDGILRLAAIDSQSVGARRLWFGLFKNFPGVSSGRHHHGEAETAAYVSKGTFRVYFGENYEEFVELGPGDCVFIPPYLPHIEVNMGDVPGEGVLARAPDNIVISLEED